MAQTTIQGSFLGDATVTGAKIGADFISAQTALTTGLSTTDEIIVSDAGVIKRMDISVLEIAATQITANGTLPVLNGSNLTTLPAANLTGTLPAISGVNLTALVAGNITAGGTFLAQDGSALTALNGTQVTTGTVAAARLDLSAKANLASPVFTTSIRITPQSSAPGSPATGTIYYDTEDNIAYVWNGSAWMALNSPPSFAATGGTETTYSGYKVHTFFVAGNSSSTNNFVVTGVAGTVDYLLVAGGGGGGGSYYSAGGGAGGVLTAGSLSLSVGSYTIVVGAGGDGGSNASPNYGNDGDDSTFNGLTAEGGGGGAHGASYVDGRAGGSGGGAGASNTTNTAVGGTGVSGQGYAGGADTGSYLAAGGGGWGGAGGGGTNSTAGNGGAGATNAYRTGSAVWYAAGGAGHQHAISTSTPYTTKQNSIGGAGSRHYTGITEDLTQADAVAETGSGGGGSDRRITSYTRAGNGSAGLVVIRYAV